MDIDKNIGSIIKTRRTQLGYSQEALANIIGVTFQQVQKYEKGSNSLNAARLLQMAKALKMSVSAFFADSEIVAGEASNRESLELVKSFNNIPDYLTRKKLSDLARAIAETMTDKG